jgi:hypothetical protein
MREDDTVPADRPVPWRNWSRPRPAEAHDRRDVVLGGLFMAGWFITAAAYAMYGVVWFELYCWTLALVFGAARVVSYARGRR